MQKWTSRRLFIVVKANRPNIEVSGTRPKIPRFSPTAITCGYDEKVLTI
jgi:hypothetical protein